MAAFSFHETKNIIAGEGGLLAINDEQFAARSEIIWEKGTNRSAFFRGETDKYGWVDMGSSFLPSEVTAAFLYAQFEKLEQIQSRRIALWSNYDHEIEKNTIFSKPHCPAYSTNNAHMYYIVFKNKELQKKALSLFKKHEITAVFHYLSLHKSKFYAQKYKGKELVNADRYSDCLVRLPLYYELNSEQQKRIIDLVNSFK
jgi:dTDP-4-amino-4,6-dideoxygalactose transaminase